MGARGREGRCARWCDHDQVRGWHEDGCTRVGRPDGADGRCERESVSGRDGQPGEGMARGVGGPDGEDGARPGKQAV
jgi:hypothetical protein